MITPILLRDPMFTVRAPLVALGLVIVLCSCSHRYYMPNMHHVPLLREKGEVRIAVASSSEAGEDHSEVNGTEIQAACAVSDHLGVMLNAANFKAVEGGDGIGRLLEIGAGHFRPFGRHGVFEVYGGLGRGDVNFSGLRIPLTKVFAQPSIGYAARNFDFAVVTRFVYVRHDQPQYNTAISSTADPEATDMTAIHGARVMVEPGFLLRIGLRSLKIQIQYAHAQNLGRPLPMFTDNVSLGLQLNINNSFRKRLRSTTVRH